MLKSNHMSGNNDVWFTGSMGCTSMLKGTHMTWNNGEDLLVQWTNTQCSKVATCQGILVSGLLVQLADSRC